MKEKCFVFFCERLPMSTPSTRIRAIRLSRRNFEEEEEEEKDKQDDGGWQRRCAVYFSFVLECTQRTLLVAIV